MEGCRDRQFFLEPQQTFHRQYEALRAVFVEGQPLELLSFGLERVGVDLEEAVELRLEVVIQRGRAEADIGGDVRPLRVLIPVAAEMLDR